MKRFISIIILIAFSSIAFAEEIQSEWKWEKTFNSIVLISSENTPEEIEKEGIPKEFLEDGATYDKILENTFRYNSR